MNSIDIFHTIEQIAATSSKNEKEGIIAALKDDQDFVRVLDAGLNPFITYGMAKLPKPSEGTGDRDFDEVTWTMLDNMASRRLTGNAAVAAVSKMLGRLDPSSAELFGRIIKKDLRAGFSESTVNKAIPGCIPTFDCMLAHKFEADRVKKFPVFVEPKLDGVRVLAFCDLDKSQVRFFSRSGKEFTTFDHLKEPLLNVIGATRVDLVTDEDDQEQADALLHVVFDGEVVSGSFNKTVGDVRRKDEQATDAEFNVFDVLPFAAFQRDDKGGYQPAGPYVRRRQLLERIVKGRPGPIKAIPRYIVNSVTEIHSIYEQTRAMGLEGLIVKDPAGLYHRRRNHGWMKIKAEESVDVRIVGVEEGTGKNVGKLGALIVEYKGVKVNVGSGLSDAQRDEFWQLQDEVVGRLIEVEYHEVTADGSLRHPRFVRFRDDKPVEQAA